MNSLARTLQRRALAVVTIITAVVLAVLVSASPAAAHDTLLSTDPAADSAVDDLPDQITLSYSGALIDEGEGATVVEVTSPSGGSVADGPPTVNGAVVTQTLTSGDEAGNYSVLWRVVSSDGHPISGEFSFTVSGSASSAGDETTAPPNEEPSESAAPSDAATPTETPVAPEVAGPATGEPSPLPWVLAGIVGVIVIGGIVALIVARSRSTRKASDGHADPDPER